MYEIESSSPRKWPMLGALSLCVGERESGARSRSRIVVEGNPLVDMI